MLYQPATTGKRKFRPAHLWTAVLAILDVLLARRADREYLDGMRPQELEDLGMRRTDVRDYRPFV